MCGFAGFLGPVHDGSVAELERMGLAIRHRGPDSAGTWTDPVAGVGLVHRRLSIVGLGPGGHQPMVSAGGRRVLCFNGEIYNHVELRQALERAGEAPAWRGTSDTETLLATIESRGVRAAVADWVGMFAFALWDRERRTLTLGRDRFGEKPLYHGWHRGRYLFGSELGALRASAGFEPVIDREALAEYFRHHYVPAPRSIFAGIAKLEPGRLATLAHDGPGRAEPVIESYWSALDVASACAADPFRGDRGEAVDAVEASLARAVEGQLVADVPVGAFLSGGIDSSAVVALANAASARPVRTFSVGFDDPAFDESVHARAVAAHLGTEHVELVLGGAEAAARVAGLPGVHDEPFADSSQLPMLAVAGLAARDVKVCLSGDGGDELFGGYARYAAAARVLRARRRAGRAGRLLARSALAVPGVRHAPTGQAAFGGSRTGRVAGRAAQLLAAAGDAAAYRDTVSYWRAPRSPLAASARGPREPAARFLEPARWRDDASVEEAMQGSDLLHYLPDDILTKVDRAAMHHSLETRVPLLDHRFAELVWTLPPAWRVATSPSKAILREIAWRHVPRALLERPKTGFGIPVAAWLRGPLRAWAEDLLDPGRIAASGLLDARTVGGLWDAFVAGDDALADAVWGVLSWQAWERGLGAGADGAMDG